MTREFHKEGIDCDLDPTKSPPPRDVQSLSRSLGALSFVGLCHNPPDFIFDLQSIHSSFSSACTWCAHLYMIPCSKDSCIFMQDEEEHITHHTPFPFPIIPSKSFSQLSTCVNWRKPSRPSFGRKISLMFPFLLFSIVCWFDRRSPQVAEQIRCSIAGK